jgi:hypothetical protein
MTHFSVPGAQFALSREGFKDMAKEVIETYLKILSQELRHLYMKDRWKWNTGPIP